jgi:hypothetical protein
MAQTQKQGRPEDRQPDQWQQDLSPQPRPGQSNSPQGEQLQYPLTAYDIKELHGILKSFSRDEMKQITVLPPGSPLNEGTRYVDLMDSERKEITAKVGMEAGASNWYVPKNQVDHVLWNRLTGL